MSSCYCMIHFQMEWASEIYQAYWLYYLGLLSRIPDLKYYHFTYRLYWNFAICLTIVLHSKIKKKILMQDRISWFAWLSFLFDFMCQEQFFSLSWLWHFWRVWALCFVEHPYFGFDWHFVIGRFRLCISGRNTMKCCFVLLMAS